MNRKALVQEFKELLDVLGRACSFACTTIVLLMLILIWYQGKFIAVEPNISILTLELIMISYGVAYSIYEVLTKYTKIYQKHQKHTH